MKVEGASPRSDIVMALETTTVISKWTGPRTAAGKAASSMNALKHGLTSRRVVMPYENQAEFDALLKDLMDESQPVGALEIELVNDIAASLWRLSRARRRECDLADVAFGGGSKQAREEFALMLRYTASIERELHRAIIRLNQVQELRRKREEHRRRDQESNARRTPQVVTVVQAASSPLHTAVSDFVSSDQMAPSPTPPKPRAERTTDHPPLTTGDQPLAPVLS
jgi:flagellar hook-basal body complex protein FliE